MTDAAPPLREPPPRLRAHRGWIGMSLDVPVDWDEAATRVREAYAVVGGRR